ncbi:MAG: hypothetical protein ACE5E6_10545 [Phycisphaerae bacterium]
MTDLETYTIEELIEELKARHDMFVAICAKPQFMGTDLDFSIVWNCGPIELRGMSEFLDKYTQKLTEQWAARQVLKDSEEEEDDDEDDG